MLANESYLQKKYGDPSVKKTLIVPISSDKGLCGGVNSAIVKDVKSTIGEDRSSYRIMTIGDKGNAGLIRPYPDILDASITAIAVPFNFPTAGAIAH